MDKKFFEMMNDVEIDFNEYEMEEVTDFNKKKYKRNFKNSIKSQTKLKKIAIVAGMMIVATVGLLQTSGGKVVLAEVAKSLGLKENYKTENVTYLDPHLNSGYTINGSIEKEGIKVNLIKAVRDDNLLKVFYKVDGNEDNRFHIGGDIYINDMKLKARDLKMDELTSDEYNIGGKSSVELDGLELGDTFNVKVDIYKMDYDVSRVDENGVATVWTAVNESKEVIGTLEFVVDNKAYEESVKYIPINKEYVLENGDKFTLEKFSSTAVAKKFYYKSDFKQLSLYNTQMAQIQLEVTDEYGNSVPGYLFGEAKPEGNIRIIDREDEKHIEYEGKATKIDDNAKELNVKVKSYISPEDVDGDWEGWQVIDEFKLDLSELK